ncbi:MAG TPA: hypothetical protein VJM83_00970 [Nitrospirota bacterium]|nr:hypothetical protein [Nitrospirota bacterium]
MKKLLIASVMAVLLFAAPNINADEAAPTKTEDGPAAAESSGGGERVVRKCPRCGEILSQSHEHIEDEEEARPYSLGADVSFYDKYVWRGININDDPVFQPAIWFSYKGFTMNVWGNLDLTDINGMAGEINEVDYTLDYSWKWDPWHFSAGAIHYTFPNTAFTATSEIYGAVGYDILLQPTLSVYYDFDEADGFYASLGIGHSFDLPQLVEPVSATLDLSAQAGFATENWNEFYFGADHTAFTNILFSSGLTVSIGDYLTVNPTVNYSTIHDRSIRSNVEDDDVFYYGVTVSAEY